MKHQHKTKFERIAFLNRWKQKHYSRNCDWVIFGVQEWWAGPENFCFKFCFFGFDLHIWFNRVKI